MEAKIIKSLSASIFIKKPAQTVTVIKIKTMRDADVNILSMV